MITIYLARHGETEENAAGILQGQLPGHLSATGREQAAALGEKLANIKADILVCSDLQRCIDTAHIALGTDRTIEQEPLLRERDWGRFTGKPIRQALVDGLDKEEDKEGCPESVAAMQQRAVTLMSKWMQLYDNKTIIAIGHGLFDRVIIATAEGKTIRDVPRMENAEVRKLCITHVPTLGDKREDDEIQATAN